MARVQSEDRGNPCLLNPTGSTGTAIPGYGTICGISWITVLKPHAGIRTPFVDASYRVLGIHPEKVLARNFWPGRKATAGANRGVPPNPQNPELPGLLLLKKPPKSVRSIPGRSSKTSTRKLDAAEKESR